MKHLTELINEQLHQLNNSKYSSLSNFISKRKDSQDFIKFINTLDSGFPDIEVSQERAQHCAIVFLLGLVFFRFAVPFNNVVNYYSNKNLAHRIWGLTSVNHDAAMYSDRIKKDAINLSKMFKYDLLAEKCGNSNVLAFTCEDIRQYAQASIVYHKNDLNEKIDHGILGGYIIWNNAKSSKDSNSVELDFKKVIAFTVAQHNMFKSETKEDDLRFPNKPNILQYPSNFKITNNTPLLYFLCLVDTIECVKRFGQGANDDLYLKTLSVLDSISIEVKEQYILIDYNNLINKIDEKNKNASLENKKDRIDFDRYYNTVKAMGNWTNYSVEEIDNYILKITKGENKNG